MTRRTNLFAQLKEKASRASVERGHLPIVLIIGGAATSALALGADFVGLGSDSQIGPSQVKMAWFGLFLAAVGVLGDLAVGRRYALRWLAQVIQDKRSLGKFLSLVLQLALLVLVIRRYQLETVAFYDTILLLTFFGFLIHHFLALRFRLPFFLLLSLAGISGLFGIPTAAWLVGLGLGLIAICHLPVSFSVRVAAILAAGLSLALLRLDWLHAPWPAALWPILGSLFMFRLIVYLYDLKHQTAPARFSQTLSYFFLLPNVVFPLFPVVDFKTFCRTYYDEDRYRIYQRGVEWIFRGLTHLLLYRFANHYLVLAPQDVASLGDLVQFLIANFLLYLRISGQFHLIVGMLHLFGFNLPETNHLYCLSSSFTDFWRRINIYWKDFMMKVFYFPAYFWLSRRGVAGSLVLSTLFVFVATWFLHVYQWFWLRGTFYLSLTDALFWAILALLVVVNSLVEAKYGRKRALGKVSWTLGSFAGQALRTAGTFAVICVLWSLWTSASLAEWFSLGSVAGVISTKNGGWTFPLSVIAVVVGGLFFAAVGAGQTGGSISKLGARLRSPAAISIALIVLYWIGSPAAYSRFGPQAQELIGNLRVPRLSKQDAALLRRGYYEDLTGVNRFNTELWGLYMKRPQSWRSLEGTDAGRLTHDFYGSALVPSVRIIFRGESYSTNRWAMRDQDYQLLPPPGTYRIALVGSSQVDGWGVADHENFESVLEERLNRNPRPGAYAKYEILNFAVGGYSALQEMMVVENKVPSFKPDAVFYIAHPNDSERAGIILADRVRTKTEAPYDYLRDLLRRAGIGWVTPMSETLKRLKPFWDELISWIYRRIAEKCRQEGILPVWILLPLEPGDLSLQDQIPKLLRFAREAGFIVLDLSDVYAGRDAKSLHVAEWDLHPNARAHQLIADRLFQALLEQRDSIPLGLSPQAAGH